MHRFTISLPDEEYNRLKEDATRNCRTLAEEITYMIRLHKRPTAPQPSQSEPYPRPPFNPTSTSTSPRRVIG